MVVFSNHRLGPSAELFVSDEVALAMLRETATAARPFAKARWEVELVLWLDKRADVAEESAAAGDGGQLLDVADIAWTPDHFATQLAFVLDAVHRAGQSSSHGLALDRWRRMIEAHPPESVQVGRRWQWPTSRPANPDAADNNLA